jgi:hypothetical protein
MIKKALLTFGEWGFFVVFYCESCVNEIPLRLPPLPLQKGGKPLKSKGSCGLIFCPLFEGGSLKGWGICFKH